MESGIYKPRNTKPATSEAKELHGSASPLESSEHDLDNILILDL